MESDELGSEGDAVKEGKCNSNSGAELNDRQCWGDLDAYQISRLLIT